MKKILTSLVVSMLVLILSVSSVSADHSTFSSTNDENRDNGWAHVNVLETGIDNGVGWVNLEFVNPRDLWSCFEYRTDGDTSQATGSPNPNVNAHNLYPYTCLNNNTQEIKFSASEYVEVRMVFGGESDERFDWTKFDVPLGPQTIADCQQGGWASYGFPNQGQCIQFVNTGK